MGQLSARCPHCRAKMQLQKPELIGKTAKCPGCKEPFVIKPIEDESPNAAKSPPKKPAAASDAAAPPAKKAATAAAAPRPSKSAAAPATKSKSGAAAVAKAKAKQDIDFDVDDEEEILEAEVVEDDEDWLKGLDSLDPSEMGKRSARTSGAAPVVRGLPSKEVKTTKNKKKRKRLLRDPDGELPLWMSRSLTVAVGSIFGLITMAIWAGMIAKTGEPSRYMALFVGATVGTGVRLGASKWDFGLFPAVTAGLIALSAVIGGKVIGINLMKRDAMEHQAMEARYQLTLAKHEDYPIHLMAEEMHREFENDGLTDAQSLYDEATELKTEADFAAFYDPKRLPEVYGEHRWKGAKDRWDALPEAEKKETRDQINAEIENLTAVANMDVGAELERDDRLRAAVGESGGALSIFDFMFAAVAVVGAFKIAAGMADSAIDASAGH